MDRNVDLLRPETTVDVCMTPLNIAAYYVSRSLVLIDLIGIWCARRLLISLASLVARNLRLRW